MTSKTPTIDLPARRPSTRAVARLTCTLLLAGAPGCRDRSGAGDTGDAETHANPAAEAGTDATRVASVTVFSDEVLWALGPEARDRVVAVSTMVDDPRYSQVADRWPESVPRIAGVAEQVLATRPDRAIVASFTTAETRSALEAAGVELVVLEHFRGFDDYATNVRAVADAVGAEAAAEALLETFEARREALARPVPDEDPTTVISWSDGSVPGAATTFDDVTRLVGLVNVAAARGRVGHGRVGAETLVTWSPDWIIVPCAPPGDAAGCRTATEAARSDPAIAATIAAGDASVLAVPSRELFDVGMGMLDLAARLRDAAEDRDTP